MHFKARGVICQDSTRSARRAHIFLAAALATFGYELPNSRSGSIQNMKHCGLVELRAEALEFEGELLPLSPPTSCPIQTMKAAAAIQMTGTAQIQSL
jgi:hypothetical protein